MTIAAGFRCSDGVVLCADTEISIQGWTKFPGSKIRMYNKYATRPIFTFAGDVLFCEMFIRKLAGRILATEKGGGDMVAAIEDEVFQVHKKFQGEAYEVESALLMSLWFERAKQKQRALIQVSQGIVSGLSEACLGTGQFVAQGMIAELFQREMTVKQTALMSVYLLAEAKTYMSGCGKESQILMLYDNGSWSVFPDDFRGPSIDEMENDYSRLKRILRPVLLGHCDLEVNAEVFAADLESFKATITANREKRRAAFAELVEREMERQEAEWLADHERQDEDEPA